MALLNKEKQKNEVDQYFTMIDTKQNIFHEFFHFARISDLSFTTNAYVIFDLLNIIHI